MARPPFHPSRSTQPQPATLAALFLLLLPPALWSQRQPSILQRHYDQAQSLQAAGKLDEAARQYRLFLADALAEFALQAAALPDYAQAAPLFDESLRLAPNSPGLRIRYAQAALAAHDDPRARTLAEGILRDDPANTKAAAKAHLLLGRVLLRTNREADARTHFEAAVALDATFENGDALAVACLDLDDGPCAAKVFAEMIAGLGDSAPLRLEIGRAYLNSDFQPESIPHFQQAIALDPKLPGAHSALAAAYLTLGGPDSLPLAAAQLDLESRLSPESSATHALLGNLALRQGRFPEAERELRRAVALDPSNIDAFFFLGQLLEATAHPQDSIAAYRQSIALTDEPGRNRFQVQKAHYLLGRLLLQSGQPEQGRGEMQIASTLLKRSLSKDRERLAGSSEETASAIPESTQAAPANTQPQTQRNPAATELQSFEARLAPALADTYNNLGVIAASSGDFTGALTAFQRAFVWNPRLDGLDRNWGRAAFQAHRFPEAIAPLTRHLQSHPEDAAARAELASATAEAANKNHADATNAATH